MKGMDAFSGRAFDMIASGVVRKALDLKQEDPRVRDRYKGVEQFLTARRLVEAGVGCVTLAYGGWDTQSGNFKQLKTQLPNLDRGIANLVQDLHDRGMADDVVTVVWGEFGRTPKINNNAGRDHWSPVMSAMIAGGGLKMGQAVGASTERGERPKDRPYKPPQVLSSRRHRLCPLPLPNVAARVRRGKRTPIANSPRQAARRRALAPALAAQPHVWPPPAQARQLSNNSRQASPCRPMEGLLAISRLPASNPSLWPPASGAAPAHDGGRRARFCPDPGVRLLHGHGPAVTLDPRPALGLGAPSRPGPRPDRRAS